MKIRIKLVLSLIILLAMLLPMLAVTVSAANHTPVAGVTVSVSGANSDKLSSGVLTVTAKGSGGIFGLGASAKTATITVTNGSGSTATVSFNWTATKVNELKIDGSAYSGSSGSFSKVMDAGSDFTVTITTAKNSTENKLVMSNFVITAAQESSNVTFKYDSNFGSITVDGSAVENGADVAIPKDGAELKATPNSGVTFIGWTDDAGKIHSTQKTYQLKPMEDMTITAVFAS